MNYSINCVENHYTNMNAFEYFGKFPNRLIESSTLQNEPGLNTNTPLFGPGVFSFEQKGAKSTMTLRAFIYDTAAVTLVLAWFFIAAYNLLGGQ